MREDNIAMMQAALSKNKFILIGRAGMDLYPDPPGTKTEEAVNFYSCLGGSSANIAVAITKLGGECSLVTCVSDDAIGRFAINELTKYGIATDFIRKVGDEARTSLALVETRIEDHQSVIYRNGAADFEMTKADIEQIEFEHYGALIATGTALAAEPSRSASFHGFEAAKQAGLPVIFDLDYRPYSWESREDASATYSKAGAMCDMIIGNDLEFGFMAGDYAKGLEKARELAALPNKIVIYKMGERGAITLTNTQEIHTGIYPVTALKPTGAGDSFMGGLIASLAAGYDLRDSVLRGSACASIVVSKVGCAPAMPSLETLENFLKTNPDLTQPEA